MARPKADWREQVDRLAMHPIWGYAVLAGVFLGFFRLIFDVGKLGEDRILNLFDILVAALTQHMNPQSALFAGVKGAVLGTAGAVAIVLPYLLPFLVGLAILEDIGYLSRVGYLMDAAMHRLGLHGTATLPVLVGYGCSVPAVMATRILTIAARPLYRGVSGRPGALLRPHDGDLRAGGILPGRELRPGHLRPEHHRGRLVGGRAGAHLAGDFTRHVDGSSRLSRARRCAWWRSKPGGGCGSLCWWRFPCWWWAAWC